jgi:hypothetical protein
MTQAEAFRHFLLGDPSFLPEPAQRFRELSSEVHAEKS